MSDDINRAARLITSSIGFLPYEEREALVPYVVKAIKEERLRCAAVAESATYISRYDGLEYDVDYRDEIAESIKVGQR